MLKSIAIEVTEDGGDDGWGWVRLAELWGDAAPELRGGDVDDGGVCEVEFCAEGRLFAGVGSGVGFTAGTSGGRGGGGGGGGVPGLSCVWFQYGPKTLGEGWRWIVHGCDEEQWLTCDCDWDSGERRCGR